MLKAPGTPGECLHLTYGELLSSFAFNVNLRRYNKVKVIPYINAERKYNAELGAKEYVQVE